MRIFPYKEVKAEDAGEGTSKLKVRWLITKEMGAPNFAMRLFEMKPGGHSPLHRHPWEHEVFILKGEVVVVEDGNETHQFKNDGNMTVTFLCLVPVRDK
jgi:quercetin dioxygenase-like cupin family protein